MARLTARPVPGQAAAPASGVRSVRGTSLLYVPPGLGAPVPGRVGHPHPAPLVVVLHGAGSGPARALEDLRDRADERDFALLAPRSAGRTWDAIRDRYGPDVAALDETLDAVFHEIPVASVSIAGFSDGASYALGLGLANGTLFHRVIAFSPGFIPPAQRDGKPSVFVSHGVDDRILPVDRCSRRIVPMLRTAGYDVDYHEFVGGHEIPTWIAAAAFP